MPQLTGMNEITVDKAALLEILRTNQAAHHAAFEQAMELFTVRALAEVDKLRDRIQTGNIPRILAIGLPIPEEHLDDYTRVIGMLQMATETVITLSEASYMMLVENEWGWQRSFAANTMSYVNNEQF